jgi:hypothetical protein
MPCDVPIILLPCLPKSLTIDPLSLRTRVALVSTTKSFPLIKRGYREMSSHLTCGVLFDVDPVWLWSIRPNSWSTIYITSHDASRLRVDHPALHQKIESKCVIIPSTFAADYPSICPDFMWVSGPKHFLDMVSLPLSGTHV